MSSQEAPAPTGPSEYAQSITVAASPDILSQDGASQSLITVTARGINGEPLRNISMRAEIVVDGLAVDFGSMSARNINTNGDGRATFVYTAPPAPAAAVDTFTIVEIVITPIGTDFNNAATRRAAIRLVPPGVVIPPDGLRASFTTSPAAPTDSQPVLFDASASVGDIAGYSWNFGDGGRGSGRVTTHTYDTAGTYFPTLTITDPFGRSASATATVVVTAGANPTAAFVFSPTTPRINQVIAFNASASRAAAGRTIVSYTWDFGDGTPLVTVGGPTITYTYGLARTYNVTLVVTDDSGKTTSATVAVNVLPPS
jgi:PKD repeat protein